MSLEWWVSSVYAAPIRLGVDWGRMHHFAVEIFYQGGVRYRAYSSDLTPLTESLGADSFCYWALVTQQAQMTRDEYAHMMGLLVELGLEPAATRAIRLLVPRLPAVCEPEAEPAAAPEQQHCSPVCWAGGSN